MKKLVATILVIVIVLFIFHASERIEVNKVSNDLSVKEANAYPEISHNRQTQPAEAELRKNEKNSTGGAISADFAVDATQETSIVISFAGDCTLGIDELQMPYDKSLPFKLEEQNYDYSYFFRGVKSVFDEDDLTLVNLEGTFTNADKKANKKYRFRGDPSYVNILKTGSIEMVNIGNNHIYDFLEKGFKDTIQTLAQAGIKYSGEGYTAYYYTSGITIASIGYSAWNTNIKGRIHDDIKRAQKKAAVIIVSFHWGTEYAYYPNSVQTELARLSIDSGAHVVIGHHPHVIQGIEKYKGRYIVYSLGNFCFGGNYKPPDMYSFIFQNRFVLKDGKIVKNEGNVIPCRVSSVLNINDYQPVILSGEEKENLLERLFTYSGKLKYGVKVGEFGG